jgi:hypothetical protein
VQLPLRIQLRVGGVVHGGVADPRRGGRYRKAGVGTRRWLQDSKDPEDGIARAKTEKRGVARDYLVQ